MRERQFARYITKLNRDESPIAVGKTVTLVLANGKILSDLEVTELLLGSESEILKSLSVADADGKKKQKIAATLMTRIRSGGHEFNVVLDPNKKGHILIDVTARDADVNERLKTMQQRLWPEPTDEERAKTIADYKELLKRVQASYTSRGKQWHIFKGLEIEGHQRIKGGLVGCWELAQAGFNGRVKVGVVGVVARVECLFFHELPEPLDEIPVG